MVKIVKPMDEKTTMILVMIQALVPGVPRSAKERSDVEEDLKMIGC